MNSELRTKNYELRTTKFEDLGLIDYKKAWDYQLELFNKILNIKQQNSNYRLQPVTPDSELPTPNYLIFCEHPNVYTLGKSGSEANLLIDLNTSKSKSFTFQKGETFSPNSELQTPNSKIHADFYRIERGGDITYHGPGQIVGYPILDLQNFKIGIKEFIWNLEEAIILTLADYNIKSERLAGATGVWITPKSTPNSELQTPNSKICAIGVRTSRYTTMHGFALNVNTDLTYFNYINPCGFTDKSVTSMQKELGIQIDIEEVKLILKNNIQKLFGMKLVDS